MELAVALYVIGLLAVSFLIFRYMRYTDWRSTPIGRAFLMMKSALLAMFVFVLVSVIWPDWPGRDVGRVILIGYADAAIITQAYIVVKFQGGFRRRRLVKDPKQVDNI